MTGPMIHDWPKEIAVRYCTTCSRVYRMAFNVNREDEVPTRYCSHCKKPIGAALYKLGRVLKTTDDA
jgi:hypothetical protein